jgi:hypothetical protein
MGVERVLLEHRDPYFIHEECCRDVLDPPQPR